MHYWSRHNAPAWESDDFSWPTRGHNWPFRCLDWFLCSSKWAVAKKVLSQKSQGGDNNPSKWLASMWFLMFIGLSSLPHTLQIHDVAIMGVPNEFLPLGTFFWPFSIMDLTFSSSVWRSALDWLGIANAVEVLRETFSFVIIFCWLGFPFWDKFLLQFIGSTTLLG